jgi:GWxTD domain-containing protein
MRRSSFLARGIVAVLATFAIAEPKVQLAPEYQRWLNEDVRWIMTSQERQEFMSLPTDQARDRFVIQFWERRSPNPGSKENAFKREHYRRLAFSNQHFAAMQPGWETDRGRIYIVYGPPDAIAVHSSSAHPDQVWSYRRLNGSENVTFRFVDRFACGDYHLVDDRPSPN